MAPPLRTEISAAVQDSETAKAAGRSSAAVRGIRPWAWRVLSLAWCVAYCGRVSVGMRGRRD